MNVVDDTVQHIVLSSWVWLRQGPHLAETTAPLPPSPPSRRFDPWRWLRQRLDAIVVDDADFARSLCQWIPATCPFERQIDLFGRTVLRIPPLCKLNPLYEEVVALRFRALSYLADECGEDISPYC